MSKSTANEERTGAARGQQVIEEAAHLLGQVLVSSTQGAYVEGHLVTISVDPRWNDDKETMRMLLTCRAFGHRRVDWERLPVHVLPEEGNSRIHVIARLNAHGQALIPNLPPGNYRLALRRKSVRVAPVLSGQVERLAAQEEESAEERRSWSGEDGAIVWTVEETEESEVQVAFETHDEAFATHRVVFSLIDRDSKQVHYSGQLTLEAAKTGGKWEGWCSLGPRTEFPGPYELIFETEPPSGERQDESSI